ncbi:MAG: tetratricopeptide repeat protein [Planctomycetaceae bacterium]
MIASSTNLQQAMEVHERGDLQQAASLYRRMIAEEPANADARHLLGVTAMQQRDFESAVESIRSAVAIDDGIPLYHSNLGAALREQGRIDEAAAEFRRAVELDPEFAGGHYNLGLVLERQGRVEQAVASLRRAVETGPGFADSYLALGRVLTSSGRAGDAVEDLERGIDRVPNCAQLHFSLGNALEASDRIEEAVASYRTAIRLNPDLPELHNNLGAALQRLAQWDDAGECFRRAVELDPDHADARYNLAGIQERDGLAEAPLDELRRVLELRPGNVDVLYTLAKCLETRGRFEEAAGHLETAAQLAPERVDVMCSLALVLSRRDPTAAQRWCERGLEIDPDSTAAWNTLGAVFFGQDDWEAAEDCFRSALTIDPEDALACYNLGNILKEQWRLDEAMDYYDRAIELDPGFAQAHVNRGVVLKYEGRLDEAIAGYTQALAAKPGDAEARFHRSLARLMQGDFARGWDEYESRWDYKATPRDFPQPVWTGSSLRDRSLLVYAEQGIGDEVMFASCLPDVLGQTRTCVIECDPRLAPLFARSFPLATVVPADRREAGVRGPQRDCDLQIAMGSLPRYLRRNSESFPLRRRYLAADATLIRRWQTRLHEIGEGLKVGISWRGGDKPTIRRRRSTTLEDWRPLLELPDLHFINLQYGECRAEIERAGDRLGVSIHHWDDVNPLKDLEGFAAQIAALDLVISIDNSAVHVAGALGVPVFTLLPFAPNWRWQLDRDDSPWYPSMRLFRQPEPECWAPVFERVAESLRGFSEESSLPDEKPPATVAGRDALARDAEVDSEVDADADAERRKYERIWTHDAYRTMSPGLADAAKVDLVEELRRRNCRTILDAGCGSGKLMQMLMTEHADEFAVHGFDISENCLDPFFDDVRQDVLTVGCLWNPDDLPGEYDAVLCTDVMEHIPPERVPDVLANLRRCTRKFAYVAIALFPDGFGPKLLGEPLHLTVRPPNWWFAKLGVAGFRIEGHAVEGDANGTDLWLHAFLGV